MSDKIGDTKSHIQGMLICEITQVICYDGNTNSKATMSIIYV
jgi:hypothetical protein